MRGESSDRQALLVCESLYPSARRLCQFRCRLAPVSCRTGVISHPWERWPGQTRPTRSGGAFSGSSYLYLEDSCLPAAGDRESPSARALARAKLSASPLQPPPRRSVFRAESGGRRVPAFVWEIAIAVAAYLVYEAARFVAVGSYPTALGHAHQVVALERHLDLNVEGGVQRAFLNSPLLPVLNYVYLAAQNLVLPASLVLLYRLNRTTYRTLRNTLLATWLLSLPVYALYPAAPPRLAGLGIVDTVSTGSPLKLEAGTTTSLFNQFAAVPSLHVGFAFAIGIALAAALRNPILRVAALHVGPGHAADRRRDRQPLRLRRDHRRGDHRPPATASTGSSRPAGPRAAASRRTRSPRAGRSTRGRARVAPARRRLRSRCERHAAGAGRVAGNLGTPPGREGRRPDRFSTAIWKEPEPGGARGQPGGRRPGRPERARRTRQGDLRLRRGGRGVVGAAPGARLGRRPSARTSPTRAVAVPRRGSASAAIGSTLLEVRQSRMPCYKLGLRMDDPRFLRAFAQADRPGAYLAIVREGDVGAGDAVEIAHRPDHDAPWRSCTRALLQEHRLPPELLAPELMPRWRAFVLERTGALDQAR